MVKNVDFSSDENALSILSEVKGNGKIKVCLDKVDSSSVAEIEVNDKYRGCWKKDSLVYSNE